MNKQAVQVDKWKCESVFSMGVMTLNFFFLSPVQIPSLLPWCALCELSSRLQM